VEDRATQTIISNSKWCSLLKRGVFKSKEVLRDISTQDPFVIAYRAGSENEKLKSA